MSGGMGVAWLKSGARMKHRIWTFRGDENSNMVMHMLGVSPQQDNSHECYDSGLGISFSLMVNAANYDARCGFDSRLLPNISAKADIDVTI